MIALSKPTNLVNFGRLVKIRGKKGKKGIMTDGGFVVKFDGKEAERCYVCKFDYDDYSYEINNKEKKAIPAGTKKIEIELE